MLDVLTADAAAKHGHEYSLPHSSLCSTTSILAQMPLSLLGSMMRKPADSIAPTAVSPIDSQSPEQADGASDHQQKTPMNPEVETPTLSPSTSRPTSSNSNASADRPKKRAPRPKTTYNFAQPPPAAGPRQKLHIRPKVLLQLHQVIAGRRPKPVYEVIPFSLLATRSTRRLARTFNSRDKLGPNDLLIVKAEGYGGSEEDGKSDDERWGARDVIGVICPGKKDDKGACCRTEVLMDDGSSWEVTNLPNGGYEFNYIDEHGLPLRSRWVPKTAHSRRVSTMSSTSQPSPILPAIDDKKFNFSTISANSRRHPVIATMSRASIEVLDSYNMPTATSPPTPGHTSSNLTTPLPTPSSVTDAISYIESNSERLPIKTDDTLRKFIIVSGIWVAFSENWSWAYSWSKSAHPSPLITSGTFRTAAPNRTVSMSFAESPRSASPSSTIDENRRTFPRFLRTGTQILHRNTSFTQSTSSESAKTSPVSSPLKTRARRSNSTGNADLNPKTGSTRRRFGLALEDQTLTETEEERQSKRSEEILRMKELALSSPRDQSTSSPPPVRILEPPAQTYRSPSPASPTNPRTFKSRSAQYDPVTTAGLWDSGVVEGSGVKRRPTSLVVVNEKKEKEKRRQERSKGRDRKGSETENDKGTEIVRGRGERFKRRISRMFRRA
ncbi:hypothetical protein CC78DRAFT_347224 [Lojkania enalia]|uniref:Uncharacterized protein n=1 Tax=Lojkania enalia TaxID=147567 RepID=A0A9P4N482_9PLEO|nr:hypothetical protein CC78DRAFT_347224 [Didymosphaeria enalia]